MFNEIPASKSSLTKRKKVYGVGVNDANYITTPRINGIKSTCDFYNRWIHMIARCYSAKLHDNHPSYKGCTVCDDWLLFSNFKEWMIKQDWQGKQLDKDILIQGNKLYSPLTCIFVDRSINTLLSNRKRGRGKYMIGVHMIKKTRIFSSQCYYRGKVVYLGNFAAEIDAHEAYKEFKYSIISEVANLQSDPLKAALLNYKISNY